MRPTDTIPEPAFSYGHNNPASPASIGQGGSPQRVATDGPAILLVEQNIQGATTLQSAMEGATGWNVTLTASADDALEAASILKSLLKIVLITTGRTYDPVLRLIRDLKELAVVNRTEFPQILVLSLISQSPEVTSSFERLGAECLLRAYSEPIVESVKKIQWKLRRDKSLPTILIRRRGGKVVEIIVTDGPARERLMVGPRFHRLLEHFAMYSRTAHSTASLADILEICRQSLKEYLRQLRLAYDRAFECPPSGLSGRDVFWTKRLPGGYVHGVNAHFEIIDEADF